MDRGICYEGVDCSNTYPPNRTSTQALVSIVTTMSGQRYYSGRCCTTVTVSYPSPIQGLCFPSSPLTSRSGFYFFFNDSHGTASVADLRVSVQLALPALSTDLRLGNRRNVFLRRRHLSPSPSGSQCYQRPRRMSWSCIRNWYPAVCALAAQDDGLPSPGKVDMICTCYAIASFFCGGLSPCFKCSTRREPEAGVRVGIIGQLSK